MMLALGCPEPKSFTVTFNSQGGSDVADATVTELEAGMGALVAKPANDPTKEASAFLGWYKEAEGQTPWNFDSDLVKANITLFAKWLMQPTIVTTGAMDWSTGNKFVTLDVPSGATAYYTTGSDDFSLSTWTEYENTAFIVNIKDSSVTVRAIAVQDGMVNSAIAIHVFEKAVTLSAPTITHEEGLLIQNTSLFTLSTTTAGAEIRYTTNGDEPTATSSLYTEPFTLDEEGEKTIKAIAIKDGMINSDVAMATWTVLDESYKHTSVFVQGGEFTMGSSESSESDNNPAHDVTLSSFYMGEVEVTQAEYEFVFGKGSINTKKNSNVTDFTHPANYVIWYQAITYCNRLSIKNGLTPVYSVAGFDNNKAWEDLAHSDFTYGASPPIDKDAWNAVTCNWSANGYRLPTEAEWEYAAKGGTHKENFIYSGSNDIEKVAWYFDNTTVGGDPKSQPVGGKDPNKLGLYDMTGNIQEWCWDWYNAKYYDSQENPDNDTDPRGPALGSERVSRGGAFDTSFSWFCPVELRSRASPNNGSSNYGFRLVRSAVK